MLKIGLRRGQVDDTTTAALDWEARSSDRVNRDYLFQSTHTSDRSSHRLKFHLFTNSFIAAAAIAEAATETAYEDPKTQITARTTVD
jgi:hypothetical protein